MSTTIEEHIDRLKQVAADPFSVALLPLSESVAWALQEIATLRRIGASCAKEQTDAMIAHRWFASTFGETMNGRDFAVKCAMADQRIDALNQELSTLRKKVQEIKEHVQRILPGA